MSLNSLNFQQEIGIDSSITNHFQKGTHFSKKPTFFVTTSCLFQNHYPLTADFDILSDFERAICLEDPNFFNYLLFFFFAKSLLRLEFFIIYL